MTQEAMISNRSDYSRQAPTEEEVCAQIERILASKHFRQAFSLERLLRYVVEKTLAGAPYELKEYVIGVDVFRRGADFEPGADAVVRVQAGKLRKKLDSFYEDEGAADPVLIELPKGHYVARFALRPGEANVSENFSALAAPLERESHLVAPLPPGAPSRVPTRLKIAAVFLMGILSLLAAQRLIGPSSEHSGTVAGKAQSSAVPPDPALNPLWEHFLKPGASNVLAFGTPQFFNSNGMFFRDVRVNSSAEENFSSELVNIQKNLGYKLTPTEVYTGVGETQGVYLLSRFFFTQERDIHVARNRLVGWEEVKNSNVVLLSSMRFHTLADELAYPSDFTITDNIDGVVINNLPQAGEQAIYRRDEKKDYALVTLWPGKVADRRLLQLSGVTTWATAAAAEYVTGPEYLRELNAQLVRCSSKAGKASHPPYFQVLLEVEVKDKQVVGIRYVTHHDLDLDESAREVAKR